MTVSMAGESDGPRSLASEISTKPSITSGVMGSANILAVHPACHRALVRVPNCAQETGVQVSHHLGGSREVTCCVAPLQDRRRQLFERQRPLYDHSVGTLGVDERVCSTGLEPPPSVAALVMPAISVVYVGDMKHADFSQVLSGVAGSRQRQ
jgi:hypothetical protein